MLISDLITMVRMQIRDTCTTKAFSDAELTQFITAALAEYSRYRPLRKPYTLSIVAGQTTYVLPADWMSPDLVAFAAATKPAGPLEPLEFALPYVQVSAPLGAQQSLMTFEWFNELQQVTLSAVPLAPLDIPFAYYALQAPATLPAQWAEAAMMPAYERALRALATDQGVKIQQYKIANNIEIDNRKVADHLLHQANAWRERFRLEVVLRPYGVMGAND